MYIKQIIVQGFKSYKDQTVIDPFSPKHNVIVGRNGSGKSNFFAAIRFVLSDAYTQMGREERQALLHEGAGSAVMSAYVELIFDNSDERFPTGKDELILRRTIGQKKDEYSIDRKSATKSDVMNLLESAGFSRSNPYYIVPQGRVTALTNMKDGERLNLLKEVAGTQVYEARRSESIRIMADTDAKRSKIDELMAHIQERLAELDEEKEELRVWEEKDRDRRCLEYTIYEREQTEINNALNALEQQRATGIEEGDENRSTFLDGEAELAEIDKEMKALKQRMELALLDKQQHEEERREVAREKAKVELEVKGIEDGQSAAQSAKAQHDNDLKQVQKAISQREQQLQSISPRYSKAQEAENAKKAALNEAEGTRQRLYAKQGRSAKFKSKAERDAWLQKEISEVYNARSSRHAVGMETTGEIEQLETDIAKLNQELSEARKAIDNRNTNMESLLSNVQNAKEARDKLQDQRKELWRQEARLDTETRNSQQELERAERTLSHMMDQNTSRGIAAVRRIKKQQNLNGVYGTLAELFTVGDRFKTAVEVTAGNSLFHVVVDNDETATRVLEQLNKEKAGRVTFMPLNRLRPKPANIPKANDAVEMISKLQFDQALEPAFQQVFGKTIICPNLQIAAQYARSHGVSAITPDGDRSDKKGALTGGYHDPQRSRLDAVKEVAKLRDEADEHRLRAGSIRQELERKDQEITRAVSELQKMESRRTQAENSYGPMQQEIRSKAVEVQAKQDSLEAKRQASAKIDVAIKELEEQENSYEKELASEFKKALSDEEEAKLAEVSAAIPNLRKEHAELSNKRAELETEKSMVEVELREGLRPRLDELKSLEHEGGSGANSANLKGQRKELNRIEKNLERVETKLQEAEQAVDEANTRLNEFSQSRAAKQAEQEEIARAIEKSQKRSEKSLAKKAVLTQKAAEVTRNIRDLGSLPEAAYGSHYNKLTSEKAIKRLHSVNEALKAYSHVNKKAFEQYSNFTRQRETLIKRRSELDTSQRSIRELIDVLDQRKDEAIERTFKQVSKEFAGIFSRLVPAGRGRLVIQRKSDRDARHAAAAASAGAGDEAADEDEAAADAAASDAERRRGQTQKQTTTTHSAVENYTGVGISVSFNSRLHDEQQRVAQLSGGQKSLCALALVFAIQQCDPAPFYLFDEIDANLDAQYRTAVAALLKDVSQGAQFICTTFRPEMVHVAEKCYGVSYANKTSSVDAVGRDEALRFVEGQVGGA